jgi:hypothetical protein
VLDDKVLEACEGSVREYRFEVNLSDADGCKRHAADPGIRSERRIHGLQAEEILDVPQLEAVEPGEPRRIWSNRAEPGRTAF